jgi:hypothetical protein
MLTVALAVAVVLGLGVAVAWALARFFHEIARFDDWDRPVSKRKKESWR